MNIGLTGGIASGKSTVSAMLVQKGAALIDADQIAREVVLPGSPVLDQVFQRFGQALRMENGALDRKKLGEIVFADASARKDLEALLHPPIRNIMKERMQQWEQAEPNRLVVVDVPLLFENNLQGMFAQTVLVYVPEEVQLERLMIRDGLGRDAARRRIDAQMSIERKKDFADVVIDNSGSLDQTEIQIDEFLRGKGMR